jgi:hypothetical protein
MAHEARLSIELDMRMRLWQLAEDEAVRVFAANLRSSSSPLPPARARRWASIPATAPA